MGGNVGLLAAPSPQGEGGGEGAQASFATYDAFGNRVSLPHTAGASFAWRGAEGSVSDHAVNLVYMQARHYDPELGRFIQPDSMMMASATTQGMNRYVYTENDPGNKTDPTGRFIPYLLGLLFALGFGVGFYTGFQNTCGNGGRGSALFGSGLGFTIGYGFPSAGLLSFLGLEGGFAGLGLGLTGGAFILIAIMLAVLAIAFLLGVLLGALLGELGCQLNLCGGNTGNSGTLAFQRSRRRLYNERLPSGLRFCEASTSQPLAGAEPC